MSFGLGKSFMGVFFFLLLGEFFFLRKFFVVVGEFVSSVVKFFSVGRCSTVVL